MVGGQVGGEWEVRWLCGLTNCFIHMQTGPERLWSLQQADSVSPWWMTVHIASRRAAALSLMQGRESRYQILLLSMNFCFCFFVFYQRGRRAIAAEKVGSFCRVSCHGCNTSICPVLGRFVPRGLKASMLRLESWQMKLYSSRQQPPRVSP